MKNKNHYIFLAFSTVFSISSSLFTMERSQGISNTSGQSMEEELKDIRSNTSNETGIHENAKQQLLIYIENLQKIMGNLNEELKEDGFELPENEYNKLKYLQGFTQQIINSANNMYLGLIPVDTILINRNINILEFIYRTYQ